MTDVMKRRVAFNNEQLTEELKFLQKVVAIILERQPGLGDLFIIDDKFHQRKDIIKRCWRDV